MSGHLNGIQGVSCFSRGGWGTNVADLRSVSLLLALCACVVTPGPAASSRSPSPLSSGWALSQGTQHGNDSRKSRQECFAEHWMPAVCFILSQQLQTYRKHLRWNYLVCCFITVSQCKTISETLETACKLIKRGIFLYHAWGGVGVRVGSWEDEGKEEPRAGFLYSFIL